MRRFKLSDLAPILEIERSSFGVDGYSKEEILRFFKENSEGFIVVEVNGKVVGYVNGHISRRKAYLDSVAVQKNFRGNGIGQKLFDFIISYFKRKKVKEVELDVAVNNRQAINWYKRLGFKIVKKIKGYYPEGGDAYLMRKNL